MTEINKVGSCRTETFLPYESQTIKTQKTGYPIQDRIEFATSDRNRKITGAELYTKSAVALTIGLVPFAASKIGQVIVKASATLTRKLLPLSFAPLLGYAVPPLRILLGIPATIGGALLFGGASGFSKSQALVWGQELIEHPQEERANTKLARYGASDRPYKDFKDLLEVFFWPPEIKHHDDFTIENRLDYLRNFKAP